MTTGDWTRRMRTDAQIKMKVRLPPCWFTRAFGTYHFNISHVQSDAD